MAGTMSVIMANTEERAKESAERISVLEDEDNLLLQEDALLAPSPEARLVQGGDTVKAKVIKEKASGSKHSEETKSKQKSKRSLIPFYSTFGFKNRSSKSPDKDKKIKGKIDPKSVNHDENEEENEKKDKEKEEEEEREKEVELIKDLNLRSDSELNIDNRLYCEMPCESTEPDDEIPQEFIVKKEIKSPKLTSKGIGESKTYSLVKARIAKYQKNTQKDRCSSPEVSNCCKGTILNKSKTLENQSKSTANKSKYATRDVVRSKFQNQVNNLSYEGVDFAGTLAERDIEYDKQELYDELKLIYDGEEIYAVREHKQEPLYLSEEPTMHRPHLSIDSITLISNKNMKASLNISVSGSPDRVVNALPDTKWKEAGRFSRRSLRKSSHKKTKEAKKKKASSGNSSISSSPPNELDLNLDSKSCHSGGSTSNIIEEHIDAYKPSAQFPEYAKVNKKKNVSTEALTTIDNLCLDYRKTAFKGCSDKGPVAKKIGQSVCKSRRDTEGNIKFGGPVKKTESFKGTKVGRKGSFTYNTRQKIVKRPVSVQQVQQGEGTGNVVKTQAVKLRRRDSHSGRKGEYRLSVTIQPSTVASLTDKFNSLISQNQTTSESTGKTQTQIPLGQVSVRDGKLGRVYHSPRASFKRKYRTRSHKNRRLSKMEAAQRLQDPHDLPATNELEEPAENTSQPTELSSPRRTKDAPRGPRIVNIQKVPSIGRAPGDNKTDEEKVYDKIETALSSGKFKGETDESDVDQDDTAATSCYEEVCRSGGKLVNRSDDEASASALPLERAAESPLHPDGIKSSDSRVFSEAAHSSATDGNEMIEKEDSTSEIAVEDPIRTENKSSSVEIFPALVSCTHQKSESIDSGILSDENTTTPVIHKIPETVEEVIYGITGSIDHCSVDTTNSLDTCKSEDSVVEEKLDSKITPSSKDLDVSPTTKEQVENNQTKESESDSFRDFKEVSSVLNNETTSFSSISKEDVLIKEEDSKALVGTGTSKLDPSQVQSCSEDCVSDTDNKIYSSILKAVVKNTVRRTKEKDSLKKELDKDMLLQEKESWFKRNRSKEREAKTIDKVKCTEHKEEENDEVSPVSTESKPAVECDKEDKPAAKESVTKQKKEKEGKIYESWIFKKLREKSQERKKFKELTPVEVNVEEDDNSKTNAVGDTEITQNNSEKSGRSNIDAKPDETNLSESIENKTIRPGDEKSDGYGLFSFKSRSRNKDKKRTKTTPEKLPENDTAAHIIDGHGSVKDFPREESISSSPASSVRTQHSRKPSDTSVCTVESEKVSGKSSATKLKLSNSQRSISSIPPPPKTPIPSPPKSARIVLNMNEIELNDDNDEGGKGSAENIYENLYSTDIDKLKKNCVKLNENGIVPNTSFLWSYATPPSVPAAAIPSTSDGRTRTPERQTPFIKITGIKSFGRPEKGRRDTSLPRMDQSSDDVHNYSELNQMSSDDSHTTVAYDEIGGLSAVSYDDVRMSSSCSYDDVRAPSSVGYDSLKAPSSGGGYDPVGPPPARTDLCQYDDCDGAVVTAQLVVVREDQLDSISYLYDDITYNSSQSSNSYEPVNPPGVGGPCAAIGAGGGVPVPPPLAAIGAGGSVPVPPPLSITSIEEVPEPENSPPPQVEGEDEEECGSVHEVFSYKLTRVGPVYSVEEATPVPVTAGPGDIVDGLPTVTGEEAATHEVPNSSPVSTAAPEPIYGSQEAVYGGTNTTNPEGESVAASPIGLRDSLRSSTSSYHSAYSTKYFTRSRMLDSTRTKEDDKIAANAVVEQRNNKKSSKPSDDYKESRLGFMGRKFRELGKIGKAKNVDKDASKKGDLKKGDRKSTAPPTKNKLGEKKTKSEREQNTEKCSDRTSLASLSEDIYGETTYGIVTVSATASKNVTEKVVYPTNTKKKVKPNLKLSDCPPLDDDFATTSDVFVTPKETDETYGPVMNYNNFRQGKGELQKSKNADMILPSTSERRVLPNSETGQHSKTFLSLGPQEFDEATQSRNQKKVNQNIDMHSSLVKETLKMMMSEASGGGHEGGTQDEWEDIGEDDSAEEDDGWGNNGVPRQLIRVPVRTRRWAAQPRVWRKTWSQGVRDITHGPRAASSHMRSDVGAGKVSHRAAGTTCRGFDPRSLAAKCEVQGRNVYREQAYLAASPSTSHKHHFDYPRSLSEPAVQHWSQIGKSLSISRDGSCGLVPSETPRGRLCDHHHLVLGRFKSRKNKYRLQDDTKPAPEGRYRKRCHPDSDGEGDAASHYEAIYEAINELQQHGHHDPRYPPDPDPGPEEEPREDFEDSFDSDESDEAYSRLQPQLPDDGSLPSPLERQESQGSGDICSSSPYQRQGSIGSAASGGTQQSITKIAEAANLGMRRLRRNWSQTKTEVKTGLNKMKKKGSAADMKSTENLYNDASPTSDEKRKWSFKNHFVRRKSTSSLVSPTHAPLSLCPVDKEKETATFYLTLTIETDKREAALAAAAAEASKRLQGMDLLKNLELLEGVNGKDLRSVLDLGRISDVGVTQRPKSCVGKITDERGGGHKGRSKSAQRRISHPRPVRPKNAPPAPPSDVSESEDGRSPECEDLSKDKLALRLNQLLSAGPTTRRGRRVLRSSHCSSSDSSPIPLLLPPDPSPTSPTAPSSFPKSHFALTSAASSSYSTRGGMLPTRNKSPSSSRGSTLPGSGRSTLKPSISCNQLNIEENCARLSEEIASCISRNIPNTRCSVVSASSSEGYIRPSDIASIPPPLPARPTGQQQRLKKASSHDDGTASSSNPATPVRTTIPEALPCPEHRSYLEFSCDSFGGQQVLQQTEEEPTYMSSQFADEPLYQFYTASVLERATYRQGECSSEDDYEVINDGSAGGAVAVIPRPTAMEIVTPADGRRTLWCELPEVASSGILNTLSSCQRKVQEAMFEVITSEASYLKSLEVLVTHFFNCPSFGPNGVLTKRDKNILFSDILPVKRCSELFLVDLEKRWQESALITTIADIVLTHARSTFSVYVKYCSNQIYQDRMLKELKENNPRFVEVLAELEASPKCQSLAMHSFLMLPMQRITRLPLLLDAIFHRLERGSPHWHECNLALATLNKVVTECNEGARKMERMEEMLIITRQLDFREVRAVPLISASRWLVKKGEITRLTWRDLDTKLTFGKRISKHTLYFFLFTDLLVVTKKKSEESYAVLDHCPRNMVQVMELDTNDKPPPGRWLEGHKNLLIVTMLQNHENKTVEMVLSCALESERTRWVEAVTPRTSDNPDEQIYEEWDCPQVQATHAYSGSQPDELSLEVSDVVNVLKKMADGWYQGERLRDGERGWFPGSYCKEIASAHVRARNLRQRYRLLTLSCSMVEELRRNASTTSSGGGGAGGDPDETKDAAAQDKEEKKERRKTVTIQDVIYSHSMK